MNMTRQPQRASSPGRRTVAPGSLAMIGAAASLIATLLVGCGGTSDAGGAPDIGSTAIETKAAPAGGGGKPTPGVSIRRSVGMVQFPVTVPSTFTGMHFHYWPPLVGYTASPAPTYAYGSVRSHNYDPKRNGRGLQWYAINPNRGEFVWDSLDNWVTSHTSNGKKLIFTFYGTPTWCSSDPTLKDPYNYPGGDSPPTDLACVTDFVTAVVARHRGKIAMFEIWNEPDSGFSGNYPYWRGTADQLAALAQAVYRAAKAADPAIRIVWPPFVEWYSTNAVWKSNLDYGNALKRLHPDPLEPGYYAEDFAFHFYGYSSGLDDLMNNQESVIKTMAELGIGNWDVYNTEMGFGDRWGKGLREADKARLIQRWMALSACYGNKAAVLYSHDGPNIGNPSISTVISKAIDDVGRKLAGSTIKACHVMTTNVVRVEFGDGSSWDI